MSSHDESADRKQRIEEIIAACLDAREAGADLSLEEIVARYPEFEKELRDFFENEGFFTSVLDADDRRPYFGNDYEVLKEIGRGGMGVVYKCHQKSLEKVVAIKTIIGRSSVTPPDIDRIHKEAQRAAGLRHTNIVAVHQVAEHKGQHFFVMEYVEGYSLAQLVRKGPLPPARAAQWVKTIADAIHHAHQRQILHCDLKPANILLDKEGKLYVSDFGLAKRMGESGRYLPRSALRGTATYMAPEQVTGDELTTATDIYGLGGILYALLTGSPPFRGRRLAETLKLVREESPTPPSEWNPKVDKDLEAICLKCLSKDKDQRYGSAYGLGNDLDRYQAGQETTARPWGRRERTIRWCRRNPLVAGLISAMALISILTVVMALSIAQAQKVALIQEAVGFAARDLAKTALLQLRDLSSVVEKAAGDATLSKLLASKNEPDLERYVERICNAGLPFQSCFVLNAAGYEVADYRIVVVAGKMVGIHQKTEGDLSWRDYFQGARAHTGLDARHSVHIAQVYRSLTDTLYKLVISAPILDDNGKFLGVICTALPTDARLGIVIPGDSRRKVALIGPEDKESAGQPQPGKAVIAFHPAYKAGLMTVSTISPIPPGTQWIHAEELNDSKLLLPARDDYADPVGSIQKEYQGRWIAGFASVGNTGFVVVVQQSYKEARAVDPSTFWNLTVWTAAVIFLAVVIVAWVLRRWFRRSNAPNIVV